jgi:endonuclease YncB( thermonuclease family)
MVRHVLRWSGAAAAAVAVLLAAAPLIAAGEVLSGMCVGVPEADLIELWVGSAAEMVTVRLAGVDGDSLRDSYGMFSQAQTKELVFGKPVQVEVVERTSTGLVVGRVLVDGNDLAALIVSQGLTRRETNTTVGAPPEDAEARARRQRLGLGGQSPPRPSPTPLRDHSNLRLSDIAWQVDRKRARNPWPTPTAGPERGVTIDMTIHSWVGANQDELIMNWGLPTSILNDGRGGRILVYERHLDPDQRKADPDTRPWRSQGRYDRQLGVWVYSERFFVDPSGRIYDHRWDVPPQER